MQTPDKKSDTRVHDLGRIKTLESPSVALNVLSPSLSLLAQPTHLREGAKLIKTWTLHECHDAWPSLVSSLLTSTAPHISSHIPTSKLLKIKFVEIEFEQKFVIIKQFNEFCKNIEIDGHG